MFGFSKKEKYDAVRAEALDVEVRSLRHQLEDITRNVEFSEKLANQSYDFEIDKLQREQEAAMARKDFEIETFKDVELQKKNDQINSLLKENAVLEEKNRMLDRIIDLDADIIDVKDLVTNLIKKLPEINLKDITINTTSKK